MLAAHLTAVRNSDYGVSEVEHTHIQAASWNVVGYVLLKEGLGVTGRFKAFPAPPVVWKISVLTILYALCYSILQREFPNTYSRWKLQWLLVAHYRLVLLAHVV